MTIKQIQEIFNMDRNFKPSAELMPEDQFWELIKISYTKSRGDFEAQQEQMEKVLRKLSPQNIIHFDNRFRQLRGQAYDWQLWAAAYIIHGGCGDDTFIDFRDWVISQGKEFFYTTISNPDSLANLNEETIDVDWEGMGYLATTVFEDLTDQEMPLGFNENQTIKGISWNEDDDEALKKMCPKLWTKYSGNE